MRDRIKGDLLCKFLRLDLIIHKNALGLREQLFHASLASARGCLIG